MEVSHNPEDSGWWCGGGDRAGCAGTAVETDAPLPTRQSSNSSTSRVVTRYSRSVVARRRHPPRRVTQRRWRRGELPEEGEITEDEEEGGSPRGASQQTTRPTSPGSPPASGETSCHTQPTHHLPTTSTAAHHPTAEEEAVGMGVGCSESPPHHCMLVFSVPGHQFHHPRHPSFASRGRLPPAPHSGPAA